MSTFIADTVVSRSRRAAGTTPDNVNMTYVVSGTSKCWAQMTVTGGVPALTTGFNVSSITDPATGAAQVNYTSAMATTQYCINASGDAFMNSIYNLATILTTSGRCIGYTSSFAAADPSVWGYSVQGNLA